MVLVRFSVGIVIFFFSSRRRHTRYWRDWSSDVCSSDLCKEWNTLPMDDAHGVRDVIGLSGMSYDNTGQLGANSWRHVAFIEQTRTVDLPMPTFGRPGDDRSDSGRSVTDGPNDESLATAQQSSVLKDRKSTRLNSSHANIS